MILCPNPYLSSASRLACGSRRVALAILALGTLLPVVAGAALTPVTSTLVAGGGTLSPDTVNGVPATDVLLGFNRGLYIDAAGTLYVPNGQSNEGRLNIVDDLGDLYRFAGTGTAGALPVDGSPALNANIPWPIDVVDDDAGNTYVTVWAPNNLDGKIYRIDPSGAIFLLAGGGTLVAGSENVPATAVRLFQPSAMQYRDGFLYFAELNLGRIARIELSNGIVTTYGGGLSDRNASPIPDPINPPDAKGFRIGDAQEIVFDSVGNLYFRTRNNGSPDAIRKITPDGKLHDVVTNNGTSTPDAGVAAADLNYSWFANGLAIDSFDNLYFQMTGSRIVILNLNTGIVSHVLQVDNFIGTQDIEIGPNGDIYMAQFGQVVRIPAIFPIVTNTAPTADCGIDDMTLTAIGDGADVSFNGAASSDPDAGDVLSYLWTIDSDPLFESDAASFSRSLPFGTHTATLTVTDLAGAMDTCSATVTINPADLAVFDCEKIEVKFCLGDADSDSSDDDSSADDGSSGCDTDKLKIDGEIGLPIGVDYAGLDARALAVALAGCDEFDCAMDFTDGGINIFEVNGGNGDHWKYRANGSGLTKLDIDWKGARFKYKESGFPVEFESELITPSETVLEMKYKMDDIGGAFTVDIDGSQLEVSADGVVSAGTGLDPEAIVVKKAGKKITVALPFALVEGSSITLSEPIPASIGVADHYTHSLGRFKLEAETGSTLDLGAETLPRNVELILGLGGQLFTNVPDSCSAGPDELKVHSRKWKAKK